MSITRSKICLWTDVLSEYYNELEFWSSFKNNEYRPELLFSDELTLHRLKKHPIALWKRTDKQS